MGNINCNIYHNYYNNNENENDKNAIENTRKDQIIIGKKNDNCDNNRENNKDNIESKTDDTIITDKNYDNNHDNSNHIIPNKDEDEIIDDVDEFSKKKRKVSIWDVSNGYLGKDSGQQGAHYGILGAQYGISGAEYGHLSSNHNNTRVRYSVDKKVQALSVAEQHGLAEATKYMWPNAKGNVLKNRKKQFKRNFINNKDKIIQQSLTNHGNKLKCINKNLKNGKKIFSIEEEKFIYDKIRMYTIVLNKPVINKQIIIWALDLAKSLNIKGFNGSGNWLNRFKQDWNVSSQVFGVRAQPSLITNFVNKEMKHGYHFIINVYIIKYRLKKYGI
jgi:hypothetical protein